MKNSNPECPREDCRFSYSPGRATLAYYPPVYDKNGVNTNPDRNRFYVEKKPNAFFRFFVYKLMGFKWIDEEIK
jgi:hypothetical protein